MRRAFLMLAAALLIIAGSIAGAGPGVHAETLGSTVLFEGHHRGIVTTPGTYSLLQEIVEVDPGHYTTTRLAGDSYWFVTVIDGTLTVRIDQQSLVVGPRQSAYIPPGTVRRYENNSLARVRFMESLILPPGAGPSPALAAPSATVATISFMQIQPLGAIGYVSDVVQQSADLAPGYRSTNRVANGNNLLTVTAGELTVSYADGAVEKVAANKTVKLATGRAYSLGNEGAAKASYIATWVSSAGTAATSPAPAAASAPAAPAANAGAITPPRTGDAGLAAPPAERSGVIHVAAVFAVAVLLSGLVRVKSLGPRR